MKTLDSARSKLRNPGKVTSRAELTSAFSLEGTALLRVGESAQVGWRQGDHRLRASLGHTT